MIAEDLRFRIAGAADAPAVAQLHAASWRSAYRGVLRDDYLDGALASERAALWHRRLVDGVDAPLEVVLMEDSRGLLGFGCLCPDADPAWGPLIDNLHVQPALRGEGLGRRLMMALCDRMAASATTTGFHLWVLEANLAARAFYRRLGGCEQTPEYHEMPDGKRYPCLRVSWARRPI
ncbi:N-acetyltransferase [Niveibacterium sp. COAC-50]|uniref:GNAT family N-acetyltransferase n=1 Tax=Niveibacterium sp. COAC-50 TaxID=2729384 RepID=UPI001551B0BB|nr:GNAT family N-acetyltransferase [Niveibacterium sp. COAC-50]